MLCLPQHSSPACSVAPDFSCKYSGAILLETAKVYPAQIIAAMYFQSYISNEILVTMIFGRKLFHGLGGLE